MTDYSNRKGPWIATYSGRRFYFEDPRAEDVCIEDIAHATSQICRFTGHTSRFLSVAEHQVNASYIVPPEDALAALLHDGHEGYVHDVSSPLKIAIGEGYKRVDLSARIAVAMRFGTPVELSPAVKLADLQLLFLEARALMNTNVDDWGIVEPPRAEGVKLFCDTPWLARKRFLGRFYELTKVC